MCDTYKKRKNASDLNDSQRKVMKHDTLNVSINEKYLDQKFQDSVSAAFLENESITFDNGVKILSEPFHCCILPNFLNSENFLRSFKNELLQLEMHEKDTDLFKFHQSSNLWDNQARVINIFKQILLEECLPLLRNMTNIPLNDTIDMSCSLYSHTDRLLCHDDELEERRIAYIFYLVPEWTVNDGGSLDLFSSENGQPSKTVTSILPVWNNFVFFEVSMISFHQVAEILTNKGRLSVSGWFHGPPLKRTLVPVDDIRSFSMPCISNTDISLWVNHLYLDPQVQIQLRKKFKELSEMQLSDFLQEDKYVSLCSCLMENERNWKLKGPANIRWYEEMETLPSLMKECVDVFCSKDMCLLLSNLTGVSLHDMADESSSDSSDDEHYNQPMCSSTVNEISLNQRKKSLCESDDMRRSEAATCVPSVRKWSNRCYTLLHDNCCLKDTLDTVLYFNCKDWDPEYGGYTSYVDKNDSEELLRVEPKGNSLGAVYCDEHTLKFVKYINCKSLNLKQPFFHDISILYFEQM